MKTKKERKRIVRRILFKNFFYEDPYWVRIVRYLSDMGWKPIEEDTKKRYSIRVEELGLNLFSYDIEESMLVSVDGVTEANMEITCAMNGEPHLWYLGNDPEKIPPDVMDILDDILEVI